MLRRAPLIPELRRYAEQHPTLALHPDRYLIAWAWEIDRVRRCDDPLASLIDYSAVISRYGQSISVEEAKAILFEASGLEPQIKGYALAKWLGIPKRLALKYRLRTISGCDTPPEQQADQRKQADKLRKEKERRETGRRTRAEVAAAGRDRAAEIAASGLPKSTWYYRRKKAAGASWTRVSAPLLPSAKGESTTGHASPTRRSATRCPGRKTPERHPIKERCSPHSKKAAVR